MTTISLELPAELFSAVLRSPEEFVCETRLAAAMHWCARGEMSREKMAEMAGLDRTDCLEARAREQPDAFVVDFEDLDRQLDRG